jgi:hypothetical protein
MDFCIGQLVTLRRLTSLETALDQVVKGKVMRGKKK